MLPCCPKGNGRLFFPAKHVSISVYYLPSSDCDARLDQISDSSVTLTTPLKLKLNPPVPSLGCAGIRSRSLPGTPQRSESSSQQSFMSSSSSLRITPPIQLSNHVRETASKTKVEPRYRIMFRHCGHDAKRYVISREHMVHGMVLQLHA